MKNILSCTILFFGIIGTQAQRQIEGLKDWDSPMGTTDFSNYYLKDLDNDFDQFEGEYLYTNGATSFRIKLVKQLNVSFWGNHSDILIGEVKYNIGPTIKVNTLSKINTAYSDPFAHKIVLFMMTQDNEFQDCSDCTPNELRVFGSLHDGKRDSDIALRKTTVNGVPALRMDKSGTWILPRIEGSPEPDLTYNIPNGEYILISQ